MNFYRWWGVFASGLWILLIAAQAQPTPKSLEGLSGLVVPMDKPSPKLEAAQRLVNTALAELPAELGQAPEFVVTKSGQGVLWGDLFKTGGCFALAELSVQRDASWEDDGAAFAEWENGRWRLLQVWDIPVTWRPEGWEESGEDYLAATPATQPFMLEDFRGDGAKDVVMAGSVGKYFQENYLMRFLPKTKELKLVAYAMAKPEKVGDYVRLYFDSGRRSIWTEWQFCKWKDEELLTVSSWHSEVGYGEKAPTFFEGMRLDGDRQPVTIRVLYGHGQEIEDGAYELSRNGQPFGAMKIGWKDKEHPPERAGVMEGAWLFEKITGLPPSLYPEREEADAIPKLEDFATITITGNDEAVRYFGVGR